MGAKLGRVRFNIYISSVHHLFAVGCNISYTSGHVDGVELFQASHQLLLHRYQLLAEPFELRRRRHVRLLHKTLTHIYRQII